ncbi:hypothetical protein DP149_00405 [Clostridium tetani]|uniref:Uncharacterized protein n=1 Tax=Clostridium tetani (strain Massachusetts / E88) TaxID=212717 RepID=Q899L6_CLOTE|nr:hypothetical protein [Clostridium tetani]AAO34808.1 hypothetical protein CTC_00156 [Clostridium tetani E88]KGI36501.1 hypothetical protein KY52_13530 [Clostridium tetani]KGI38819.1 hypothetical protein LA33_08945 [Clostridium tetani ATCC 9441]KGI42581.1 hypothetical protein KY54_12970 [Clostridium tetani]KHO38698.1 hypothetical protein OR63_00585 [Clostridium tetani]
MYNEYNKIFWGIFIATFNIKLGAIKILPTFIGYIIILNGLSSLYKKTHIEPFNKSKTFAIIIIIITALSEFMEFSSIESNNLFLFNEIWIVFSSVIELLIFYNFFDGSIEYFNNNNICDLACETIKKLRFYIIVSVINIIFLNFALIFNITFLNIIIPIILIILRIYLIMLIYRFKNTSVEEIETK